MLTSREDGFGQARQAFAEQFEEAGSAFIYRKSQKGEAIRVTAEEHSRFVDDFDRDVRRAKWIIYAGLTVVLGATLLLSALQGSDLSQFLIFLGIGAVMVPYFCYYHWAWARPARELAGRTPVASRRSAEEFRRLRFKRMSYGHLAGAAFAGLVIPFIGSGREGAFSGWDRLWLVLGGGLILFAASQAFLKWRSEQEDSSKNSIPGWHSNIAATEPGFTSPMKSQLWRYLPLVLFLLGLALIAYTPAGKQLAKQPSFLPIVMVACGGWSVFTVVRGFSTGRIQPFARGFYNTYERESEPRRFWASAVWNGVFGFLCLWLALIVGRQTSAETAQRQCYDQQSAFSAREEVAACTKLIATSDNTNRPYLLGARATAYQMLHDRDRALADYNEAIRLNPRDPFTHFNRGSIFQQRGDTRQAIADFTAVIALQPDSAEAYLQRGSAYEHIGQFGKAIVDFDTVIRLKPGLPQGYYYRGEAYANSGNDERAKADYDTAARLDPRMRSPYS